MKQIIVTILFLCPFLLNAQHRGVNPIGNDGSGGAATVTRALVIGISDYQDADIPSLKYAHRDAEEFKAYLESPSGGAISPDNIEMIANEEATVANIYSKLDWLLEKVQEGEQVIIYFSGHGDVETTTSRNRGFLLAHDTPPTNYRIGALRVSDLNDILGDLVEINRAKVLLITDACRSGKLAGGAEGATSTASALSQEFKNQIKILSCKPDELSLEGEQWGGGRGVFSYHLIDGLMGMANLDSNEDEIMLFELEDYLKSKIQRETDFSQSPVLVGPSKTPLSRVDSDELAALRIKRSDETPSMAVVSTRGREDQILAKADTSIQQLYQEFLTAVEDQYFLPADINEKRKAGKSASELFDILFAEKSLQELHSAMKRNFAVALQDESQKSINAYLKADPEELNERWKNYGDKYKSNPAYLSKAASLLGETHYLYDDLMAKKYYYEGLISRLEGEKLNSDSLFNLAKEKINVALKYDDAAAFIYNELGLVEKELYKIEKENNNQEIAGKLYNDQISNFEKAKSISPKWVMPQVNLASIYFLHGEHEMSEAICKSLLAEDPDLLGPNWYLGNIYHDRKEFEKAILYYTKTIEVAPYDNPLFYANLGHAYIYTEQYGLSEKTLAEAVKLDANYIDAYKNFGFLYYMSGDYEKSKASNLKWIELSPKESMPYFNVACLSSLLGDGKEAVDYLERAINKGFDKYDWIEEDGDLKNARSTEEYKLFTEKYLPENK